MPDSRGFLPPPPWEGPPLPEAFLRAFQLTPERIRLVQEINNEIRKRQTYGPRQETIIRTPFSILEWSNGSAEWWRSRGTIRVSATQRAKELEARYNKGDMSQELFIQMSELKWEDWRPAKVGDTHTLDANQILVYATAADIDAVVRWLEPLPLYSFSFEAKQRGIFDPQGWLQSLLKTWYERHRGE